MNEWFYLLFGVMAWSAKDIALGARTWMRRRRLRALVRAERTCAEFAEARADLMGLVISGRLDPHSYTFRSIYFLTTHVMRRPDEYEELSSWFRKVRWTGRDQVRERSQLSVEAEAWTPEVRDVVRRTVRAMDAIVMNYSFALRCVHWLELRFSAVSALASVLELLANWVERLERRNRREVGEVREAQEMMMRLAHA